MGLDRSEAFRPKAGVGPSPRMSTTHRIPTDIWPNDKKRLERSGANAIIHTATTACNK